MLRDVCRACSKYELIQGGDMEKFDWSKYLHIRHDAPSSPQMAPFRHSVLITCSSNSLINCRCLKPRVSRHATCRHDVINTRNSSSSGSQEADTNFACLQPSSLPFPAKDSPQVCWALILAKASNPPRPLTDSLFRKRRMFLRLPAFETWLFVKRRVRTYVDTP